MDCLEELLKVFLFKNKVVFVGDGMNDVFVLVWVDVGIVMGGLGSDVVIEVVDVVIMNDELSCIVFVIKLLRKILRIVK